MEHCKKLYYKLPLGCDIPVLITSALTGSIHANCVKENKYTLLVRRYKVFG